MDQDRDLDRDRELDRDRDRDREKIIRKNFLDSFHLLTWGI